MGQESLPPAGCRLNVEDGGNVMWKRLRNASIIVSICGAEVAVIGGLAWIGDQLLAQAPPQPIADLPAASGWVGAGLLGVILWWLLWKHLPDKDKMILDLIAQHDKKSETLVSTFNLHAREIREDNKEKMGMILEHCKDEMREARDQQVKAVREAIEPTRLLLTTLIDKMDAALKGFAK